MSDTTKKIAIIGAGFTGLSAAEKLMKQGYAVTLFEKDAQPGGLAISYKKEAWKWRLEQHYHHWFTNDISAFALAKSVKQRIVTVTPKTSIYLDKAIYQLDSPKALLQFPKLSFFERFRMGVVLALLRYNPLWQPLEQMSATVVLPKLMGEKAWKMIWEPQLVNKMGKFAAEMSLVFFWARIFKRTKNLSYPEGGYGSFADKIVASFIAHGGDVQYNTEILSLQKAKAGKVSVQTGKESFLFDKVIVTTPSSLFCKMAPQLPHSYKQKLEKLRSIGATDLVLRLKKPLLLDKTYWLSICKKNAPIMVVVEHTNLISPSYYNNEHIVYLGNYLERTSKAYSMTKEEKLRLFDPFLKQINPDYRKNLIGYDLFKAPFAQPIVTTNYSRKIPSMQTPMSNVYLANIDQVYPWDRGTNYAIELGNKVAKLI